MAQNTSSKYQLQDAADVFRNYDVVLAATYGQVKAYNRQRALDDTRGAYGTVAMMFESWFETLWELHGNGCQLASPVQSLAVMRIALESSQSPHIHLRPNLPKALCAFMREAAGTPEYQQACAGSPLPRKAAKGAAVKEAVQLLPQETALLETCEKYRDQLASQSLIEKGDAISYLLAHADEAFPRQVSVCMLSSAPLQPQHVRFLQGLEDAGAILFTQLNNEGGSYNPESVPTMERTSESISLQFAFPSGKYAAPQLVAELLEEYMEDGPIVVACKRPLEYFQALAPAFAANNKLSIRATVREKTPFAATDFGRTFLCLCACLYEDTVPWNRTSLVDALQGPLLRKYASTVWRLDSKLRGNRHIDRATVLEKLCEGKLFKAYYELATAPTPAVVAYIMQSFDKIEGYSSREVQEQQAALSALEEVFNAFWKEGCNPAEIVPSVLPLLSSVSIDVRVANWSGGAGEKPQVSFVNQHSAAQYTPSDCATMIVCDLDTENYPAAQKENAATLLLDKIGVPRGETTIERLRRDWVGLQSAPEKRIVLMRCLNNTAGDPTYPCAMLEEFVDCYRKDVSTTDDIDNTYALPRELQDGSMPGVLKMKTCGEEDVVSNIVPHYPQEKSAQLPYVADIEFAQAQMLVPGEDDPSVIDALKDTEGRLVLSPSQIETYLACPFQWFMSRRMGAESPDEAFGPAEAGTFRHDVMEGFLKEFKDKVTAENRMNANEILESVMDAVTAEHYAEKSNGAPGRRGRYAPLPNTSEGMSLELAKQELREWLDAEQGFLRRVSLRDANPEEGLFPSCFEPAEVEFDLTQFEIDYAGCRLSGRVDRIDIDSLSKRAVVVDYKGSLGAEHNIKKEKASPRRPYITKSSKIQALIYAGAIQKSAELQNHLGLRADADGLAVVGELYMSYKRGNAVRGTYVSSCINREASLPTMGKSNTGVTASEFADLLEQTETMVAEQVVNRILAGDIAPNPTSKKSCQYCPVVACPERKSSES